MDTIILTSLAILLSLVIVTIIIGAVIVMTTTIATVIIYPFHRILSTLIRRRSRSG